MCAKRTMSVRFLAYALCTMLTLSGGSQSVIADEFDAVREMIRNGIVDGQPASLTVTVLRDGKELWAEGFGWADREQRRAADVHTPYSLASISKPITATGLMVLVQREKLDLDRAANEYLGDAKLRARVGDVDEATLRTIANHTSGLPLHWQFFFDDETARAPSRDVTIRRYGQLFTPPGETYQYSNLGYGVLDYIVERTLGRDFKDFMHNELFVPLGMTRSGVDLPPALKGQEAVRYDTSGQVLPHYEFDHPGASAVYASAHDLARFGAFHVQTPFDDQAEILSEESITAMQETPIELGYGVGWAVSLLPSGKRRVQHSGGMPGVSTRLTLVPEEKIVIVALANGRSSLPLRATNEILKILLPDEFASDSEANTANAESEDTSPELSGRWKGQIETYGGPEAISLWFQDDGDIHVRVGDQLETLVSDVKLTGNILTGEFAGSLATDDVLRATCNLHLHLRLEGERLHGVVIARAISPTRHHFALSHWAELQREVPAVDADSVEPE